MIRARWSSSLSYPLPLFGSKRKSPVTSSNTMQAMDHISAAVSYFEPNSTCRTGGYQKWQMLWDPQTGPTSSIQDVCELSNPRGVSQLGHVACHLFPMGWEMKTNTHMESIHPDTQPFIRQCWTDILHVQCKETSTKDLILFSKLRKTSANSCITQHHHFPYNKHPHLASMMFLSCILTITCHRSLY